MLRPSEVLITAEPLDVFADHVDAERWRAFQRTVEEGRARLSGRTWWNVSSTARGGGVAEMLRSILSYARGAGVDTRWLVLQGTPAFFRITKRLHHALHGSVGDGSPLGDAERRVYEEVLRDNLEELAPLVRAGDVVLLHDPQTAGLTASLVGLGARVAWRCHIGSGVGNDEVARAWAFLLPYLTQAHVTVFTRQAYVPRALADKSVIIQPSIDIFSVKNQPMDDGTVRAILRHTGLVQGPDDGTPVFQRRDGVQGRVDRCADIVRNGPAPALDAPLVTQVSRWDPLKDPAGVMQGFAALLRTTPSLGAHLVLAGPSVNSVADDPEAASTFDAVLAQWRCLPHVTRSRVHLICLPMADVEENAAIVNALQRHAAVVVQKSLEEGFGLTVTEAMWKGRPVVASRVGGIQDQLEDGVHGLLVRDPRDLTAFAAALGRVLTDAPLAARLGAAARQRVLDAFTGVRHLTDYARLIDRLYGGAAVAPPPERPAPRLEPVAPAAEASVH